VRTLVEADEDVPMHTHPLTPVAMATLCLAVCVRPARSGDAEKAPAGAALTPQQTRTAIEQGLAFLEKDAVAWRTQRECATCHHGTMTVWALSEAMDQGYAVGAETLADAIRWTKDQWVPRFRKPRDPRPGWNLVNVPAIYLGVMSQTLPILSRDEVNQVAVHLARHQEADGAWLLPPPANGAPPVWESRETLALWALLAWEPHVPPDPQEAAAARASREKALAWLGETRPTDTTQALGLRVLLDARTGKSTEQIQAGIDRLLGTQNADGGWSQVQDCPSDAYATGQTLWFLSGAGVKRDRPEIGRAVSFLVASQRKDGSWPMTSRNHPGVETTRNPIRNPVPITYFGSAWATIGLVRSVPMPVPTDPTEK
jgi:N-acyl-D-amino-acid deacylase